MRREESLKSISPAPTSDQHGLVPQEVSATSSDGAQRSQEGAGEFSIPTIIDILNPALADIGPDSFIDMWFVLEFAPAGTFLRRARGWAKRREIKIAERFQATGWPSCEPPAGVVFPSEIFAAMAGPLGQLVLEDPLRSAPRSIVGVDRAAPGSERTVEIVRRELGPWRPIETAPRDGTEVLLKVKSRAGVAGKGLVGHYMPGGHCIEDHPPIDEGWYFWNGCMFDREAQPTHWCPLPTEDEGPDGLEMARHRILKAVIERFAERADAWKRMGTSRPPIEITITANFVVEDLRAVCARMTP